MSSPDKNAFSGTNQHAFVHRGRSTTIDTLNGIAAEKGLTVCDVPGEGTCLFHSVGLLAPLARTGSPSASIPINGHDLRRVMCDFMESSFGYVKTSSGITIRDAINNLGMETYEAYIARMRARNVYGDETAILAMASLLLVRIVVLSLSQGGRMWHTVDPVPSLAGEAKLDSEPRETIYIACYSEKHFVALLDPNDRSQSKLRSFMEPVYDDQGHFVYTKSLVPLRPLLGPSDVSILLSYLSFLKQYNEKGNAVREIEVIDKETIRTQRKRDELSGEPRQPALAGVGGSANPPAKRARINVDAPYTALPGDYDDLSASPQYPFDTPSPRHRPDVPSEDAPDVLVSNGENGTWQKARTSLSASPIPGYADDRRDTAPLPTSQMPTEEVPSVSHAPPPTSETSFPPTLPVSSSWAPGAIHGGGRTSSIPTERVSFWATPQGAPLDSAHPPAGATPSALHNTTTTTPVLPYGKSVAGGAQWVSDARKRLVASATGWAGRPLAAAVRGLTRPVPNPEYDRLIEAASIAEKRVFTSVFSVEGVGIPVAQGQSITTAKKAAQKKAAWRRKLYTSLYGWVGEEAGASLVEGVASAISAIESTGAPAPASPGAGIAAVRRAVEDVLSDALSDAFASALRSFLPPGLTFVAFPDPNHPAAAAVVSEAIFSCDRAVGDNVKAAWEASWKDMARASFCQVFSALPGASRAGFVGEAVGGQAGAAVMRLFAVLSRERESVADDLAASAGGFAAYAFKELLVPLMAPASVGGLTALFAYPAWPVEEDLVSFAEHVLSSGPSGEVKYGRFSRARGAVRLGQEPPEREPGEGWRGGSERATASTPEFEELAEALALNGVGSLYARTSPSPAAARVAPMYRRRPPQEGPDPGHGTPPEADQDVAGLLNEIELLRGTPRELEARLTFDRTLGASTAPVTLTATVLTTLPAAVTVVWRGGASQRKLASVALSTSAPPGSPWAGAVDERDLAFEAFDAKQKGISPPHPDPQRYAFSATTSIMIRPPFTWKESGVYACAVSGADGSRLCDTKGAAVRVVFTCARCSQRVEATRPPRSPGGPCRFDVRPTSPASAGAGAGAGAEDAESFFVSCEGACRQAQALSPGGGAPLYEWRQGSPYAENLLMAADAVERLHSVAASRAPFEVDAAASEFGLAGLVDILAADATGSRDGEASVLADALLSALDGEDARSAASYLLSSGFVGRRLVEALRQRFGGSHDDMSSWLRERASESGRTLRRWDGIKDFVRRARGCLRDLKRGYAAVSAMAESASRGRPGKAPAQGPDGMSLRDLRRLVTLHPSGGLTEDTSRFDGATACGPLHGLHSGCGDGPNRAGELERSSIGAWEGQHDPHDRLPEPMSLFGYSGVGAGSASDEAACISVCRALVARAAEAGKSGAWVIASSIRPGSKRVGRGVNYDSIFSNISDAISKACVENDFSQSAVTRSMAMVKRYNTRVLLNPPKIRGIETITWANVKTSILYD